MTAKTHIKPVHAVFCDDIRREITGKEILIGVYSNGLLLNRFPAPVMLSIWVPFSRDEPGSGEISLEFRVIDTDGHSVGYASNKINVAPLSEISRYGSIALPGLPMLLAKPTTLTFQMKQYDKSWQDIASLNVLRLPTSAPTAPELPLGQSASAAPVSDSVPEPPPPASPTRRRRS